MNRFLTALSILAIVFIFTACSTVQLYQDLNEEDANEILVLLSENGIKAQKKKVMAQNEVSYAIEVGENDMVRARSLLLRHNLPRRKELGLTGVYKEKGLIPTPDEQKARFLLALKGEIINSLERMPQIVDADVVLNIPTKDEFASPEAQKDKRPTASIVVKARALVEGEEPISEAKVQQFVANSVEGLNPRDVAVIITYLTSEAFQGTPKKPEDVRSLPSAVTPMPAQASVDSSSTTGDEIIGLKLDTKSKAKLKIYLLIFFVVLILLALALILSIVQASRTRRQLQMLKSNSGDQPAIEGRIMDESPPELPEGEE